jgi:DNA-binding IclR family transcriptional regulator
MREIAEKTGETVNLAIFTAGTLAYVEIIDGRHALRMSGEIGQTVPLHATALGKATLACLSEERQRELLGEEPYEAFAPNTHTTWRSLQGDIGETAQRGFAIDVEEMDEGAACVGATIVGTGEPLGGISASGFAARFDERKRLAVGELLSDWCSRIGEQVSSSVADGAA